MATNLEFIKSASASAVNSISVTDCFSDKYSVYHIVENFTNPDANVNIYVRYINSSGVVTTSTYDAAHLDLNTYASYGEGRYNNQTFFEAWGFIATIYDTYAGISIHYNPYDSSSYTFHTRQNEGSTASGGRGRKGIGVEETSQQITGIQYFLQSSANCDFEVVVYGVK